MTGSATGSTVLAARSAEATAYLARVEAALADLPADDRGELLEELAAHLDELTAEGDVVLEQRLGTPEEYAAELRSSAGLPPGDGVVVGLRDRLSQMGTRRDIRAIRGFLTSLRPAWWVLRAWVAVGLVAMWPGQTTATWADAAPFVPRVGTPLAGFLVLLVAVVISVQVGRRTPSRPPGRRAWVLVANTVAALALLPVVVSFGEGNHPTYVYVDRQQPTRVPAEGVYASGTQVWNVYPYDSAGRLLHDVRLYDQDGTPLTLDLAPDGTRRPVVDGEGRLVQNAYPYRYVEPDGTVADPDAGPTVDAPPLVVPQPAATAAPTPTPTATGRSATDGKRDRKR